MIQIARAAALVAVLTAPALAQDLTGTWFEAKLTARLLVDVPDPEPGVAAPTFDGVAPRTLVKNTFYLRVDEFVGLYVASIWTATDDGLVEADTTAWLSVLPAGVTQITLEAPIVEQTKSGFDDLGDLGVRVTGRIRAKVDSSGDLKAARFTSIGGRAEGRLVVDGSLDDVYGAPKLRLKAVAAEKVPPLADDLGKEQ